MGEESKKVTEEVAEDKPIKRPKQQSLPPIELVYRQVFDLLDSKVFGFESQIRINDKKLGTLTPDLFVPIAERSNQIVELGKWSFVEMSDMIRRQRLKEHTINCMFMPVSVKYVCKKYFADNLTRQMEKAQMAPDSVCVMLAAHDINEHLTTVKEAIALVREKGIKIAVTGIGGEGLAMTALTDLQVDFLRFDATFVEQLLTSERAKDVANSFGALAVQLGAQLMAEGVDTKEHTAVLTEIGCSLMQGAYFADFERENRMFP